MAVSDCIRHCKRCGVEFRRTGKGQPIYYCGSECRTLRKAEAAQPKLPHQLTCALCETEFLSPRRKKYCCLRCSWKAQLRKKGVVSLDQHLQRVRVAANWFECEHCGKPSHRTLSKGNAGPNRFCSMKCRGGAARAREAREAEDRAAARAISSRVAAEVSALRRIARWTAGMSPTVRPCRCCGRKASGIGEYRRTCSPCQKELVKRQRKTEAGRRLRRVHKAKRRAVERGLKADRIDPIKVFERDKWRCHLCKQRTPKHLRGSYEAMAPELDHVVPLAMGGTHTWGNVACACRACNGAKGAQALGQVLLPLTA